MALLHGTCKVPRPSVPGPPAPVLSKGRSCTTAHSCSCSAKCPSCSEPPPGSPPPDAPPLQDGAIKAALLRETPGRELQCEGLHSVFIVLGHPLKEFLCPFLFRPQLHALLPMTLTRFSPLFCFPKTLPLHAGDWSTER